MAIKNLTSGIAEIRQGITDVKSVYLGDTLIWGAYVLPYRINELEFPSYSNDIRISIRKITGANASGFHLQISTDNENFDTIYTFNIDSHGYTHFHRDFEMGTTYYFRLKMISSEKVGEVKSIYVGFL